MASGDNRPILTKRVLNEASFKGQKNLNRLSKIRSFHKHEVL